jgi:hypothetical protein
MGNKKYLFILTTITICFSPFYSSVVADNDDIVNINMVGESSRTRFNDPVIVAGVWHLINVTIDEHQFQELILKFYKDTSIPSPVNRNESNYYEWRYNANKQGWTDEYQYGGYSYINTSNCEKNDNIYSFYIGVKDTLPEITRYCENWTLDIFIDSNKIHSNNIVLEKPMIGLARSHADKIRFSIEPFEEMFKKGDDYFIIENVGNIPLYISVEYGSYNNLIEISNSSKTLSPFSTFRQYIALQSGNWKPGLLTISGSVSGIIPNSLIITTAVITLETSFDINAANLDISIGHANYTIQEIKKSNIVFQYEKNLKMKEGQIKEIIVYISGDGLVTFDIWSDNENLSILEITSKDKQGAPLIISSKNTSEYAVKIKVEALRENKIGTIYYELKIDETTENYFTKINIGPPASQNTFVQFNLSTTTIIVVLLIFLVIGYIIYSQLKHRRR